MIFTVGEGGAPVGATAGATDGIASGVAVGVAAGLLEGLAAATTSSAGNIVCGVVNGQVQRSQQTTQNKVSTLETNKMGAVHQQDGRCVPLACRLDGLLSRGFLLASLGAGLLVGADAGRNT